MGCSIRIAGRHAGGAEVSVVGKQCFGFAQHFWQSNDLVQHRLKLLFVIGGLHHIDGHHQKTVPTGSRCTTSGMLNTVHNARVNLLAAGGKQLLLWRSSWQALRAASEQEKVGGGGQGAGVARGCRRTHFTRMVSGSVSVPKRII
jgi:hypothetical protein